MAGNPLPTSWEAGMALEAVQAQAGHRSIEATRIYANSRELHQTREKLRVAMSGRCSSGLSGALGMAA
jgi:hypothetical protein